jgi:hypothetical protein
MRTIAILSLLLLAPVMVWAKYYDDPEQALRQLQGQVCGGYLGSHPNDRLLMSFAFTKGATDTEVAFRWLDTYQPPAYDTFTPSILLGLPHQKSGIVATLSSIDGSVVIQSPSGRSYFAFKVIGSRGNFTLVGNQWIIAQKRKVGFDWRCMSIENSGVR